jgi:hypothetical protein
MAVKCRRCEKSGEYKLSLTFAPFKPPGWTAEKGPPLANLTVRTEGLYCADERTWSGPRIVDVPMQLQVEAWFSTRGLGVPDFQATVATWVRVTDPVELAKEEKANAFELRM